MFCTKTRLLYGESDSQVQFKQRSNMMSDYTSYVVSSKDFVASDGRINLGWSNMNKNTTYI